MKTLALLALTAGCSALEAGLTATAAQAAPQPVAITSAVMSRGYDGNAVGVTSTFKPNAGKIHCVARTNRAGTFTAGSVWIAVNAGGKHNYAFLQKTLPKQAGRTIQFAASLPRPWPVGTYRVDLFLNGKLVRSVPFTVTS